MATVPDQRHWLDYRRTLTWDGEKGDGWGTHHGVYAPIETDQLQGQVVRIPSGQATTPRRESHDVVLVAVAGEFDFTVGENSWAVEPFDLLVIPAGVEHAFGNFGFDAALFFVIHDRAAGDEADPSDDGAEVTHLPWREYRRRVVYRGGLSDRYGYHRGVYPFVETGSMRGHCVRVPAGQGSPWHTASGDVVFVGLRGEIEVYVDKEAYSLGPLDLLTVPPLYALQNVGFSDALYFVMGSKSGGGGVKPEYFEPAELGNPLAGHGPKIDP